MKQLALALLVLLAGACAMRAQDAIQKRLAEGAAAYASADFSRAAAVYEALIKDGHADATVLYNLGNTYFKSGKNTRSILCYERALLLDPSDEQIRDNLAIANTRIRDRVETMPLFFAVQWWNDIKRAHTPSGLFCWSFMLLGATMALAFVFFGMHNVLLRRVALALGNLAVLLFAASVFLYFDKVEDLEARRDAIVTTGEVVARSTADKSGVDAFTVHEGLRVEITDARADLVRIRLADGTEGWVSEKAIERI
ncbi:MAG: tetratricopeptide repeat protein [Ignavibacteria bacterium]|nr:tetratricopeptide repeat protein [Ignavibacteria bacterium]